METMQYATHWRGNSLYAVYADGHELFIGSRLTPSYEAAVASHTATADQASGRAVFCNDHILDGPVYDPAVYEADFGAWAWMIFPTALHRSAGSFHALNVYEDNSTYFGLMQEQVHCEYIQLVYNAQHSEAERYRQVQQAVNHCKEILHGHLTKDCPAITAQLVYECLQCEGVDTALIQQALFTDDAEQRLLALLSAQDKLRANIITGAHANMNCHYRLQPYQYSSSYHHLILT